MFKRRIQGNIDIQGPLSTRLDVANDDAISQRSKDSTGISYAIHHERSRGNRPLQIQVAHKLLSLSLILHGDMQICHRQETHTMRTGNEGLVDKSRRLNEWAARECPVLVTPPLECDLSIHLDRITVESVRRLDQLAPYGAENPAPVFLLEKAVVEGVYPVSEGRHCRLRLRQGNACIYAVWFGMHPEQLPYATGDVVDAALSLSVYEAARGAQLSGRILELHPAGFGNAAAQQTALVQALRRGSPLTAQQRALIAPERSDIITVYRELQARRWHAEDMQPLFAKLGEEHTGKTLVALTALEQVGLIAAVERGGAKFWELVPTAGKKNLADAPILKCLEE